MHYPISVAYELTLLAPPMGLTSNKGQLDGQSPEDQCPATMRDKVSA